MSESAFTGRETRERTVLVLLPISGRCTDTDEHRQELAGLAEAAGATVVATMIQERPRPDPATLIGPGKVADVAAACATHEAHLVIFDHELSPAQLRNLEDRLDRRVIDRTQLILDIFARRARTREGKLQVELAQLRYLLPRLVGSAAAFSRLGGGIGTRGPGETKLETDRRKIRLRITSLTRALAAVEQRRARLRERRRRTARPTVALVGYTNAGKTTLFNLLTKAGATESDALFVTLDPLARELKLPGRQAVLLSDTVGFIDRLPHTLVAAFRATLEEVAKADLLLHVVDAARASASHQMDAVTRVLAEVGATEVDQLVVFNKCDALTPEQRSRLEQRYPAAFFVSALRGEGVEPLLRAVASALALDTRRITMDLDPDQAKDRELLSRLYRYARVLQHAAHGRRVSIEAEVPRRLVARFRGADVG
ncbi:MAG: GTPase HflX [Luteitalea sp.]|nr:GTPase HflX [Luteitalea sp.]